MESQLVQLLQKPNALEDGSLQKVVQEVMASRVLSDMTRVVDLRLLSFFFFFFRVVGDGGVYLQCVTRRFCYLCLRRR